MAEPEPSVDPRDLLAAYEAESLQQCQRSILGASALGLVLVLAFVPFDVLRHPEVSKGALAFRFATVLGLFAVLWIARQERGRRFARLLGLTLSVLVGTMMCAMMALTGGQQSHYFSGLSMILLATALAIPWRPSWTFAMCAAVIGVFVLSSAAVGQLDVTFVDNLFILLPTGVIAIVTTTINERLRWREFQTRWSVAQAYRHKNEFFANMSHELRTPIHVIIGYMDMLLDDAVETTKTEGRGVLERVRQEGMLLYRLVSDLLDYAKVEAGRMDVQRETFDLRELLEQVAESFHPLADRRALRIGARVRGSLPTMHSDRQKLRQVLNNLIGNAVKFTESGGIRVEAGLMREFDAGELSELVFLDNAGADAPERGSPDAVLAIAVSDTGLGIRESDLSKLAVDFQQVNSREASKYGGTGLGLSLSRKLIGLLGGRIAVRSRYQRGSTFMVLLPASEIVDREAVRASASKRSLAPADHLAVGPPNGEGPLAAIVSPSPSPH
jgi:signal transduction histidine kinase